MKASNAYKRNNAIYIHALSQTTSGVWIATSPFLYYESKTADYNLGGGVLEALSQSKLRVPHPESFDLLFSPLLELCGVKSFATFMRRAKCVEVEATNNRVKFVPTHNFGPTEGFTPLSEYSIETDYPNTNEQLGLSLLKAFDFCQ